MSLLESIIKDVAVNKLDGFVAEKAPGAHKAFSVVMLVVSLVLIVGTVLAVKWFLNDIMS